MSCKNDGILPNPLSDIEKHSEMPPQLSCSDLGHSVAIPTETKDAKCKQLLRRAPLARRLSKRTGVLGQTVLNQRAKSDATHNPPRCCGVEDVEGNSTNDSQTIIEGTKLPTQSDASSQKYTNNGRQKRRTPDVTTGDCPTVCYEIAIDVGARRDSSDENQPPAKSRKIGDRNVSQVCGDEFGDLCPWDSLESLLAAVDKFGCEKEDGEIFRGWEANTKGGVRQRQRRNSLGSRRKQKNLAVKRRHSTGTPPSPSAAFEGSGFIAASNSTFGKRKKNARSDDGLQFENCDEYANCLSLEGGRQQRRSSSIGVNCKVEDVCFGECSEEESNNFTGGLVDPLLTTEELSEAGAADDDSASTIRRQESETLLGCSHSKDVVVASSRQCDSSPSSLSAEADSVENSDLSLNVSRRSVAVDDDLVKILAALKLSQRKKQTKIDCVELDGVNGYQRGKTATTPRMHNQRRLRCPHNVQCMVIKTYEVCEAMTPLYLLELGPRVTPQTRCLLGQWMVYVQRKLPSPLTSHTLHLSVGLMDRYLSEVLKNSMKCDDKDDTERTAESRSTRRTEARHAVGSQVEAIAASCILIASKVEEVMQVDVDDLSKMTDNGVAREDILSWEQKILDTLHYDVNFPTTLDFLEEMMTRAGMMVAPDGDNNNNSRGASDPFGCPSPFSSSSPFSSPLPLDCGEMSPLSSTSPYHWLDLEGRTGKKERNTLALIGEEHDGHHVTSALNMEDYERARFQAPVEGWEPCYTEGLDRTAYQACALYICEVCLMHHKIVGIPYHHVAAAAIFASITCIDKTPRQLRYLPIPVRKMLIPEEEKALRATIATVLAILEEHENEDPQKEKRNQVSEGTIDPQFQDLPYDEYEQMKLKELSQFKLVNFARDVDAKHKDACKFFLGALRCLDELPQPANSIAT